MSSVVSESTYVSYLNWDEINPIANIAARCTATDKVNWRRGIYRYMHRRNPANHARSKPRCELITFGHFLST
jgi:uncharacterized protein (DUF488 family)